MSEGGDPKVENEGERRDAFREPNRLHKNRRDGLLQRRV